VVGPDRPPAGQVDGHGGQDEDRDQAEAGLGDHGDHRRHPQQHGRHPGPQAHPLADPAERRGAPGQHQHRLHQQVVDHEEGEAAAAKADSDTGERPAAPPASVWTSQANPTAVTMAV
jgi:hypothetical protein